MACSSWTSDEDAVLLGLYPELSASDISLYLGRTVSAVRIRAHRIGAAKRVWARNLNPCLKSEVCGLYNKGLTMREIQDCKGLSYHQVRRILEHAGQEIDRSRTSKRRIRKLTPEEQARVRHLWKDGESILQISKKIGCWTGIIQRFRDEGGLKERDVPGLISKAQRREFTLKERTFIVREFTENMKTRDEVARLVGCDRKLITRVLQEEGVDIKRWTSKKLSTIFREQFRSGRKISPKAGNGIRTPCRTPFQGHVTMRSTTEAKRARELDSEGCAWFYEVRGYPLSDGRNYLPDFWVADMACEKARGVLGDNPSNVEIRKFLSGMKYRVEDVKGWYDRRHPSFDKITMFRVEHDYLKFHVLVEQKQGGWVWL